MAEGITQGENSQRIKKDISVDRDQISIQPSLSGPASSEDQPTIIWTPPFIIIFFVILVVGLSTASLLSAGVINHYFNELPVCIPFALPLFVCLIILAIRTYSGWIRLGALFGCIWTFLVILRFSLDFISLNPIIIVIPHLQIALNSALLCACICFSVARTPNSRWDTWFFRITPLVGSGVIFAIFVLASVEAYPLPHTEQLISNTIITLCILAWWLRPSCWKAQPGPTLLFSLAPTLLGILSIPGYATPSMNAFFPQVVLLVLLLAVLRLLQQEQRMQSHASKLSSVHSEKD